MKEIQTDEFLRVGDISLINQNGNLRYIKYGGLEILRGIYPAVRDHNWSTVPPKLEKREIIQNDHELILDLTVRYQQGAIHFLADFHVRCTKHGLSYRLEGEALSNFKKNRIGFNILHPLETCRGAECVVGHPDGGTTKGRFPQDVSPHQPFKNIRSMTWWPAKGIEASLRFDGDVFETEDQRNWTDASFKTYSTPLDLPFPVEMQTGDKIIQQVVLDINASSSYQIHASEPGVRIEIFHDQSVDMPALGTCYPDEDAVPDAREIRLMRELRWHHWRFDLHFDGGWREMLQKSREWSERLDIKLELALHFTDNHSRELPDFIALAQNAKISSILLFHKGHDTTPDWLVQAVAPKMRKAFPNALIIGGTDCFFAQLNRDPPAADLLDGLAYSINPQVHAFDSASITETLEGQADTVKTARHLANGKAVIVGPVTLKMRFNPDATEQDGDEQQRKLSQVDPRQRTVFCAAWTMGSIKYLAQSGAASATFFEAYGPRGFLEGGVPPPREWPGTSLHEVFPAWYMLWLLKPFTTGKIIISSSNKPLEADALVLKNGKRQRHGFAKTRALIANFSGKERQTTLAPLQGKFLVRTLGEAQWDGYLNNPDEIVLPEKTVEARDGGLAITLAPGEIAICVSVA